MRLKSVSAAATAVALASSASFAGWEVSRKPDKMTGQMGVSIGAAGKITAGQWKSEPAIVGVACAKNAPSIFVLFPRVVGSQKTSEITYRFDNAPQVKTKWVMTSFTEAYILDAKPVAAFLAAARNSSHLIIRLADITAGLTDAEFDMSGGAQAIPQLPCVK